MRYVPLVLLLSAASVRADDLGLKVPPGFRVTLWADHTLANDIYTMALDEKGRVVVSGPGYVRRLEDTDGDGKADRATDIAETKTGAMGIIFGHDPAVGDGFSLFLSADNSIAAFRRPSGDDRYRLNDARWPKFPFSEHGGHSFKCGPDGRVYAVAGNDGRLIELGLEPSSPIQRPEAGGLIRFPLWHLRSIEAVAHGFRNPYDFDFTPLGDIITFDSDTERDYLLPWYSPTRVYHVMPGVHHGWRLSGYMRSLARRDYYPDTVPILADMGRGSPTGVCCYRHTQFPAHYRGGVFLLDWTFGKVYYLPLIPDGSSYRAADPQVFLEPAGQNGFAPTAARVAPDGSLFISIGGRGTRGAVYKIEYLINGETPPIPRAEPGNDLDQVLNAQQPLEAWSQARWRPLAEQIDGKEFGRIALDETETDDHRIRALEILNARPGTFGHAFVTALSKSRSPFVRARLAWALSGASGERTRLALGSLADDPDPRVSVAAVTALADTAAADQTVPVPQLRPRNDLAAVLRWAGNKDRRVRLATARLIAHLSAGDRAVLAQSALDGGIPFALVTVVVAETWPGLREPTARHGVLSTALVAMQRAKSPDERVEALRTLQLGFGDWNLTSPPTELLSAYSVPNPSAGNAAYLRLACRESMSAIRKRFPSGNEHEDLEASRVLTMLQDDSPDAVRKTLEKFTPVSSPTSDFHYLTVLTRLGAPRSEKQTKQVADALLGMEGKLHGRHLRIKQNWGARLRELVGELLKLHPGLDKLVAAHPDLLKPGHVVIAARLGGEPRAEAARRFLTAVRADEDFPLSVELIDLLAGLPAEEIRPVLRARWSDRGMREAIIRQLARNPEATDRGRFLEVLETASGEALRAALDAIAGLPRDPEPNNLVPLLARLGQSFADPKEAAARKQLLALINRQAGQSFAVTESKTEPATLAAAYRPVFAWFEKAHPAEAKRLNAAGEDEAAVRKMLPAVKWDAGDPERGRKLYRDRGCQACHSGSARVAPDLAGVGKRFSRDDLLTAIVNPSRDVAPAYRVTHVDTRDGKRVSGIVVFESADGLILQTGAAETRRIAAEDIETRTVSPKSLMPDGLLRGLRHEELADLFAFLGNL